MKAILAGLLACCAIAAPAVAQVSQQPNAAPLKTMQRARSYSLLNRSSHTIVAAQIRMSDNRQRDLTWDQPVRPQEGRNIAVPANECLTVITVKFRSGRSMQSGSPDCRDTRITVRDDSIQIGSSASARPPIQ